MARKLTTLGLYPGQEQVLKILADGGDMMMGELAAALKVRPPTASKTIGRLAAQGLVERRTAGGADGRLVQVGLTQAGRDKAAAIDDLWFAAEDEMLADMDAKEARRLRKLCAASRRRCGPMPRMPPTRRTRPRRPEASAASPTQSFFGAMAR